MSTCSQCLVLCILFTVAVCTAASTQNSADVKTIPANRHSSLEIFTNSWDDVCGLVHEHEARLCFQKTNLTATEEDKFRGFLRDSCSANTVTNDNCTFLAEVSDNFTRSLCFSRCLGTTPAWANLGTSICLNMGNVKTWCSDQAGDSKSSKLASAVSHPNTSATNSARTSFSFSFGILMLCLAMVAAVELQIAFLKA